MKSFTIQEINAILEGELVGNTDQKILGLEEIDKAGNSQITFIGSRKYAQKWDDSNAAAAIINEGLKAEPGENRALIKVKNADLAMAKLLEVFIKEPPHFDVDIHPTAVIHETATIGEGTKIGAGSYIGKDVVLGAAVIVYPNVTILDETKIGAIQLFGQVRLFGSELR